MTDRAEKRPCRMRYWRPPATALPRRVMPEISLEIAQKAGSRLKPAALPLQEINKVFLAVLRSVADRYIAEIEEELKDLRDSRRFS